MTTRRIAVLAAHAAVLFLLAQWFYGPDRLASSPTINLTAYAIFGTLSAFGLLLAYGSLVLPEDSPPRPKAAELAEAVSVGIVGLEVLVLVGILWRRVLLDGS